MVGSSGSPGAAGQNPLIDFDAIVETNRNLSMGVGLG
jgi:hypothetical protein